MSEERFNLLFDAIALATSISKECLSKIHDARLAQVDLEHQVKLVHAKLDVLLNLHGINLNQKVAA